jgi:hypothetical protein
MLSNRLLMIAALPSAIRQLTETEGPPLTIPLHQLY